MSFLPWFSSLDKSILHVFIHEDLYSIYDIQALSVAEEYYKGSGSDVVKKETLSDGSNVDTLRLSRRLLGEVAGHMLDRNKRIQFWKKGGGSGSGSRWVEAYEHIASAGRFQCLEDELGSHFHASDRYHLTRESLIAAVVLSTESHIGIAVARSLDQQIVAYELASGKNQLEDVEAILVQSGVREILIVPNNTADTAKKARMDPASIDETLDKQLNIALETLLCTMKRTNAAINILSAETLDSLHYINSICGDTIVKSASEKFIYKDSKGFSLALLATNALLHYTDAVPGSFEFNVGSISGYLLYDSQVSSALGLLPSAGRSSSQNIFKNSDDTQSAYQSDDDLDDSRATAQIENPSGGGANDVYSILSAAHRTPMGRRMVKNWLQAPLCGSTGAFKIKERQKIIGMLASTHAIARGKLRDDSTNGLLSCPDVQTSAGRFVERSKANTSVGSSGVKRSHESASTSESNEVEFIYRARLADMVTVYRCILRLRGIVDIFTELNPSKCETDDVYLLAPARVCLGQLSRFQALVEEVVDESALSKVTLAAPAQHEEHIKFCNRLRCGTNSNGKVRIRPTFTPDLERAHDRLTQLEVSMMQEADRCNALANSTESKKTSKVSKGKSKSQLKSENTAVFLEFSNVHGVHLRVTKRNSEHVLTALRASSKVIDSELRILSQQNAGILFVSPVLAKLVAQYSTQLLVRDQLEGNIIRQALHVACTSQSSIRRMSEIIAETDVLAALAYIAAMNDWCCPHLEAERGIVEVRGMRHCVVESQLGRSAYIPSDFVMRNGTENVNQRLALLTGPNMGGKSTYIRALGVVAVLAQIGSFVPASVCKLPLFDRILCRVGACDSLSRGISTFKAEMLELQEILSLTTNRSLVIIDELGRGTSTHEGFGIASATVEYLSHVSAVTVFATHFHELTLLADDSSSNTSQYGAIINLHVETKVNENGVTMLYNVRPGPCQHSFGIHVSRLARFPDEVVKDAEQIANQLDQPVGHMQSSPISIFGL